MTNTERPSRKIVCEIDLDEFTAAIATIVAGQVREHLALGRTFQTPNERAAIATDVAAQVATVLAGYELGEGEMPESWNPHGSE